MLGISNHHIFRKSFYLLLYLVFCSFESQLRFINRKLLSRTIFSLWPMLSETDIVSRRLWRIRAGTAILPLIQENFLGSPKMITNDHESLFMSVRSLLTFLLISYGPVVEYVLEIVSMRDRKRLSYFAFIKADLHWKQSVPNKYPFNEIYIYIYTCTVKNIIILVRYSIFNNLKTDPFLSKRCNTYSNFTFKPKNHFKRMVLVKKYYSPVGGMLSLWRT